MGEGLVQKVPFDGLRERVLGAVLCFRYDNQYIVRVPFDRLRERVFLANQYRAMEGGLAACRIFGDLRRRGGARSVPKEWSDSGTPEGRWRRGMGVELANA